MKKLLGFFIVLILSSVVYTVVAQEEESISSSTSTPAPTSTSTAERNTYGDNWFVSLGGSADLLFAEQDVDAPWTKRLKFGGGLTFGKWFNPYFGARIQIMGGALRGFQFADARGGYYVHDNYDHSKDYYVTDGVYTINGVQGTYSGTIPAYPIGGPIWIDDNGNATPQSIGRVNPIYANSKNWYQKPGAIVGGFWQDFNYGSATIDLMANFTTLMRGHYKDHSLIDFVPFAGFGLVHAFYNGLTTPRYNYLVFKLGFRLDFNITNNLAIYLEPQGSATGTEFDGYVGTEYADIYANLGLGIQYTFNKRFDKTSGFSQEQLDELNRKINENRYMIENHQDILERQQNLLDKLEKCCDGNQTSTKEVVTVVDNNSCGLPDYVRFALDSYRIDQTEQRKISDVANYLNSATNSRLLIVGYADRKTGNPQYNLSLSQRRVEAVAAALTRLGISADRISIEWKGDKEQPFLPNEWNRVVIMVERK